MITELLEERTRLRVELAEVEEQRKAILEKRKELYRQQERVARRIREYETTPPQEQLEQLIKETPPPADVHIKASVLQDMEDTSREAVVAPLLHELDRPLFPRIKEQQQSLGYMLGVRNELRSFVAKPVIVDGWADTSYHVSMCSSATEIIKLMLRLYEQEKAALARPKIKAVK